MSETNNTPKPPLAAVFNEHGTPFSINMPKLNSLDNILENPAIKEILEAPPKLIVVTDTQIQDLINKTGQPDYMEKINALKEQRLMPERREYMESFVGSFMSVTKEENPALHDFINAFADKLAQEEKKYNTIISSDMDGIKPTPLTQFKVSATLSYIHNSLKSGYNLAPSEPLHYSPETQVLKLPDNSFDKTAYFERLSEKLKNAVIIQNPPPGTNKEWQALITLHEVGHVLDKKATQTTAQQDYFTALEPHITDHTTTIDDLETNSKTTDIYAGHANETDQDLNAYYAIGHLTSSGVFEYWAAHRIAMQSEKHIETTETPRGDKAHILPTESHDSGFFLLEYMQTGKTPNYFDVSNNTNLFYEKTLEFIRNEYELDTNSHPTPAQFLSGVEHALKTEPSIYTAGEKSIAQNYRYAMSDVLNIQRQELTAKTPETSTTPENTLATGTIEHNPPTNNALGLK